MRQQLAYELEQELMAELEMPTTLRPQVRIRHVRRRLQGEFEYFDPRPPDRNATLLTRFAFGGYTLTGQHHRIIRQVARAIITLMARAPSPLHCIVVSVEGHEDEVGDPARFGNVGQARALTVAQALRAQLTQLMRRVPRANQRNVDIQVSTAGPTRPIRSNVTADGRAQNRRVEIRSMISDRCGGTVII
jgi:outer membrane protein OmpA-like peptidoglycan-associated protein